MAITQSKRIKAPKPGRLGRKQHTAKVPRGKSRPFKHMFRVNFSQTRRVLDGCLAELQASSFLELNLNFINLGHYRASDLFSYQPSPPLKCLGARRTPSYVFLQESSCDGDAVDMSPAKIRVIHEAGYEAAVMLKHSLDSFDSDRHIRYFGTLQSTNATRFIFQQVEIWLQAFLYREHLICGRYVTAGEKPIVFRFIQALPALTSSKPLASVNTSQHTMTLSCAFFDQQMSLSALSSSSISDEDLTHLRATTLVHELVHYVSKHHWFPFLRKIDDKSLRDYLFTWSTRIDHIQDMDLVRHFREPDIISASKRRGESLHYSYRAGYGRANGGVVWLNGELRKTTFGMEDVIQLARCPSGAYFSLLNAESYACYVASTAQELLHNAVNKKTSEGKSVMKRITCRRWERERAQ